MQAQTAKEAWVQRYDSPQVGSLDYAFNVVTDAAGNVIVAGYSDEGSGRRDVLVIKYSGTGVPLWTNRYNGPDNWYSGQATAVPVAVDGNGNVFVTGSWNSVRGYVTIAFSGAGAALWTNFYHGPGNNDFARAVAVDGGGNVFVTGSSVGIGTSWDYATIAYSGAGVPLWTNRLNLEEPYSDDLASALAVDSSGNVFVTGNLATIGYSGAGVALWTNRNTGPASAVAVDSGGKVFVTGYTYTFELNNDYVTTAYSAVGVPLWTNRYDGPTFFGRRSDDAASAVVVDNGGNVVVTGNSTDSRVADTRSDYGTIAYSGTGVALWTNRYNGPQNTDDRAAAIAVDHNGNIFVTGSSQIGWMTNSYTTIAYSRAGVALWTNRCVGPRSESANAVAVDNSGQVLVTVPSFGTGGDPDAAIIAYSGAGSALWTNRYNGPGNGGDNATAMTVAGSGNVIVTGYSVGLGDVYSGERNSADFVTIAYSEAGVPLWTNRYNGLGNGPDLATAVAVDGGGRVFVTGSSLGYGTSYDYATVAYSGAGMPVWTNRYKGLDGIFGEDKPASIAVDGSGNVFVTGSSTGVGLGPGYDFATVAYSGEGVALWTNRYNGLDRGMGGDGDGDDRAVAVAVDNSGRVFVTGSSDGNGSSSDFATIAYSGEGLALWTNRYNGPGNGSDRAADLAIDQRGNVFVTGASIGGSGNSDYATVAYSRAGVALWTNRYDGTGATNDTAYAIAVDSNTNVFVTGYSLGEGSYDYATVAYSGTGVALWTNRYGGPDNAIDYPTAIAVDGSGNVFVTGASAADYVTIAYSGAGAALWTKGYSGLSTGWNVPARRGLAVGRDGAVYVTGFSSGKYSNVSAYDYATIKYVWRPHLVIQPFTAGSSSLNLTLSGPQNSSWPVQRAPKPAGPWTNLGSSLIGTNGVGNFRDFNPPANGAFYRTAPP